MFLLLSKFKVPKLTFRLIKADSFIVQNTNLHYELVQHKYPQMKSVKDKTIYQPELRISSTQISQDEIRKK